MKPLFPQWADSALRIVLGAIAVGAVALVAAAMIYVRTPFARGKLAEIDQPVEFDHRHHAGDDAIDCVYCHYTVERAPTAGVPPTDVCMGCHSQLWQDSPLLEPVRRSWFSGDPIPWNRVHDLADFVFFDHSVHVRVGVGCVTCHGRVDLMPRVQQVAPLTMQWCLGCHRNPEPHLRPLEAITSLEWTPPDPDVGARVARELGVRHLTNCTACHR